MAAKIGIIGGSGLYQLPGLENVREERVATPFGEPSDVIVTGKIKSVEACFLPRHGRGHRFLPSEVNYCANIAALKQLGCTHVVSVSAVGSMKESISPGDMVLADQFIDWTKGRRRSTFFGDGVVGHIPFGDPICRETWDIAYNAVKPLGLKVHKGGTYICIEGPQFSTKAESQFYRSLGVSVIGMTNVPECKLAREAGLSFVTLAMATDFDCWHPQHDAVTVEDVVKTLHQNVDNVKRALAEIIPAIAAKTTLPLKGDRWSAVMTSPEQRVKNTVTKLEMILSD
jgi:5'-methylthioadenosine phosphorylase